MNTINNILIDLLSVVIGKHGLVDIPYIECALFSLLLNVRTPILSVVRIELQESPPAGESSRVCVICLVKFYFEVIINILWQPMI